MAKAFNISDVRFENENMVLTIDNQLVTLELSDISEKLATATDQERRDFKISLSDRDDLLVKEIGRRLMAVKNIREGKAPKRTIAQMINK
ncbi:MAG: hypothetical protein NT004_14990 [Bacteroidetes bacterium]|nr:hypothetical protein [Bacteroidota bacterium]